MSTESSNNEPSQHAIPEGRDLTSGSIPRHLLAFSIPLLMGSVLQTLYSIVNAFWVGNALGKDALAAVAISMQVFFVLMAAALGLTMGASIVIAQAFGAKDFPQVRRVVQTSVVLTFAVSVVCVLFGYGFMDTLLRVIQTDRHVIPLAMGYMKIFMLTMPLTFEMFLMISLLRGIGDSKTPLYFQSGSLVINAALDPLLIYGLVGFPKLGLNGTAIATVIAQAIAITGLLVYLNSKRHMVAPDWLHLRVDRPVAWLMVRVGVPAMFQQSLIAIGSFVVTGLVNGFGAVGMAAYGLATRVDQFAFLPAMMIGTAVSTLAGQNIGAKQYNRVNEVFRWGLVLGCGMTAVAAVFVYAFPGFLMHMFIKDTDVINAGIGYLRIMSFAYLIFAVMFVTNGIINGAGHTFVTTLISLVSLWLVRVPLAEYISRKMHRLEGIWYAMLLSYAIGTLISLVYYFTGRWKKPIGKQPPSIETVEMADMSGGIPDQECVPSIELATIDESSDLII